MSDKQQPEKVVFNDEIFVTRMEEESYSGRKKLIYVKNPELRSLGIILTWIGLVLGGGALGYKYALGILPNSLGYTFFGLAMLTIAVLGLIMDYYSSDIYYKKVD